ncbi:uncharacterized protein LOC107265728 isoform X2 [Cephus cinctus]|uniref:Uncharacterized protein LOC107265728 isoform X2 n=1 Tax=Cephus cinctus TaxID=211228 RepID=A0AAJ7FGP8_CEPCN|nr:uncharacterized protein LOC107265728 isoform X2 [Cephus cinctus]
MLLTFFYMIATWIQAWRLSSLRARLNIAFQGPETSRPSITFHTRSPVCTKEETCGDKSIAGIGNGGTEDLLSSYFCGNHNVAKLSDLLWFQGDKCLCTIYPQQKVDVTDWLQYPYGKTLFPLCTYNCTQVGLHQDCKMHVLIEADLKSYNPVVTNKTTKLEDYGLIVAWTTDRSLGLILETDLDHITKFSIALMNDQCFINNGFSLTRIQSVLVSGKPCAYNSDQLNHIHNKKLIGKAQCEAHMKRLQIFSSTARLVSQQRMTIEVEDPPGIFISPGSESLTLQMPTILEITIPGDLSDMKEESSNSPVPSTPPPTPASATAIINGTASRLSQALTNSVDLSPTPYLDSSAILSDTPNRSESQNLHLKDVINIEVASSVNLLGSSSFKSSHVTDEGEGRTLSPKKLPSTSTANYSPSKKLVTGSGNYSKPPNVLIYADSTIAIENVKNVLDATLNKDKYTIYTLSLEEAQNEVWMDQATLVVVCGNVGVDIASQLVEYMVQGGKLLALCSNTLHTLLPSFKTAEVREHELVRFSYGKWKHVRMMHHIFCYQASPAKTKFSQDHEDVKVAAPQTPASANVRDKAGKSHTFHVRVLGTEEIWHTPSILLANLPTSGGKAVFSQIHLEADPSQYEFEESKFNALKQSNTARLEIFSDLLGTQLGMDVSSEPRTEPIYGSAFFLGRHELKLEMLDRLKAKMQPNDLLRMSKLEIQFCDRTTKAAPASEFLLPVMVHQCPDKFSTVEYFENLTSEHLGRLVIYADIMSSSMDVVAGTTLHHGLVVIPRRQTKGQGRKKNIWLSPEGCAMFTLQLHIPLNSPLGRHLPILQHLVAVSIVSAIKSIPGYKLLLWNCRNLISGSSGLTTFMRAVQQKLVV